jgi:hypothetical protein
MRLPWPRSERKGNGTDTNLHRHWWQHRPRMPVLPFSGGQPRESIGDRLSGQVERRTGGPRTCARLAGEEEAAAELLRRYEPAIRRTVRARLRESRLRRLLDSMGMVVTRRVSARSSTKCASILWPRSRVARVGSRPAVTRWLLTTSAAGTPRKGDGRFRLIHGNYAASISSQPLVLRCVMLSASL